MKTALFCVALFALPACSLFHVSGKGDAAAPGTTAPAYERIVFAASKATPAERAACDAAGGIVQPSGKLRWENCVQTFADAGNPCSDKAGCLGECRYEGDPELPPGKAVTGTCQVTDARFGCVTRVENGRIASTICVD
jgi:hypothetical protein